MSTAGRPEGRAKEVAVVGGGLAGSYCAHLLGRAGMNVTLYDMGRSGVGTSLPFRCIPLRLPHISMGPNLPDRPSAGYFAQLAPFLTAITVLTWG